MNRLTLPSSQRLLLVPLVGTLLFSSLVGANEVTIYVNNPVYYNVNGLQKSATQDRKSGTYAVRVDSSQLNTYGRYGGNGTLYVDGKPQKVIFEKNSFDVDRAKAEAALAHPEKNQRDGICRTKGACEPTNDVQPAPKESPQGPPDPIPNPTPDPTVRPTGNPVPVPPPPPPAPDPGPTSVPPGPVQTTAPDPEPARSNAPVVIDPTPDNPTHGQVVSPVIPPKVDDVLQDAAGRSLVDSANKYLQNNYDSALNDQKQIEGAYKDVPLPELQKRFQRSEENLSKQIADLESSTSGLDPSDAARFRNVLLNARDKAAAANEIMAQTKTGNADGILAGTPLQGLLDAKGPLGSLGAPDLTQLFGSEEGMSPNSNEALINRVALHEGLPVDVRSSLDPKLKLFEKTSLKLKNGSVVKLNILHNGYILGGSITGLDCSSLVTRVLPEEVRKTRFTTLDLLAIWLYRITGTFPRPPVYPTERKQLIMGVASAFQAIDLHETQPKPGDLLVYRFVTDTTGHVMITQSYNPARMEADVIEASQSAGGIRNRSFDLSIDPYGAKDRRVRPGLFALRLKPSENKACGRVAAGTTASSKMPNSSGGKKQ